MQRNWHTPCLNRDEIRSHEMINDIRFNNQQLNQRWFALLVRKFRRAKCGAQLVHGTQQGDGAFSGFCTSFSGSRSSLPPAMSFTGWRADRRTEAPGHTLVSGRKSARTVQRLWKQPTCAVRNAATSSSATARNAVKSSKRTGKCAHTVKATCSRKSTISLNAVPSHKSCGSKSIG